MMEGVGYALKTTVVYPVKGMRAITKKVRGRVGSNPKKGKATFSHHQMDYLRCSTEGRPQDRCQGSLETRTNLATEAHLGTRELRCFDTFEINEILIILKL